MISSDPWIWVSAIFTLMVFSFLYKETRIYRFAEYTFIGVGTGHAIVSGINALRSRVFTPLSQGNMLLLLPLILGLLSILILVPRFSYLAFWPMAIVLGVGTGLTMRGLVTSQLIGQLQAMIKSLNPAQSGFNLASNLIAFILTITTLSYFLFTIMIKQEGTSGTIRKVGRYGLMIAWGTLLGNVVMSRLALTLSRVLFLLINWLGIAG